MKTILFTGNPNYGLAEAFSRIEKADFISRSNNYDLCSKDGIERAKVLSLDYDVFVNSSALYNFHQTKLFDSIWNYWKLCGKSGYIVNVGSTTDRTTKGSGWIYQIEKKSLREISNQRGLLGVWGGTGIRVSYISFGSLSTPKVIEKHPDRKLLETQRAAEIIKYLIDMPADLVVNEISVDPIQ